MLHTVFPYDCVEMSADGREVTILDQTLLPNQEKFLHLTTSEEVFYAITLLKVRGAPAIGIAAAFGVAVSMNRFRARNLEAFEKEFIRVKRSLYISRPTAVNLMWALNRMEKAFYSTKWNLQEGDPKALDILRNALTVEARAIKQEDVRMCLAISEYGASLINRQSMGILTHCNAGHLACSRYGTALGPIYMAQQLGFSPRVFVDETRPLLQGARLTAFELMKAGLDATLICDNMASIIMRQGKVDLVLVGCDRVAANGDVANKIGTSALAILARHYGIPFYVLGPSSTVDFNCPSGDDIVIEERPSYEVTDIFFDKPVAPKGIKVYNPSFDITPADFITGIVTEKGIFSPYDLMRLQNNG